MKIHHNTAKKAKTHGITLVVEDGEIVASKGDVRLASGLSGSAVLETALDKLSGATPLGANPPKAKRASKPRKARDEDEDGDDADGEGVDDAEGDEPGEDDEEGSDEGKSIIKRKYKTKYKPFKMTNGDDLAQQLKEYLTYDDGGVDRIDGELLKRFAIANECWVKEYVLLNPGQRRMNVGNRLRAKVRRDGYEVKWVK